MKPEVSVIIINYNTFELTSKCIRSVVKKTEGVNYEIVVVDNASDEKNPDVFTEEFPFIRVVKSAKNLGFAGGNNLGIYHATGEYMLLLNSDTELKNNAVKLAYDKLKNDRDIGVISCKLLNYDGSIQKQCNRMESIGLELIELLRMHKLLSRKKRGKLLQGSYYHHQESLYTDKVWGTFFMFPQRVLNGFPGKRLHDDYFMYGEDVQWCYYIRKHVKMNILYYPQGEVYHKGGGSLFDEDKYSTQLKHRYATLRQYYGQFYLQVLGMLKYLNRRIQEKKNKAGNTKSKEIIRIFVKKMYQ